MTSAARPETESRRLRILHELRILDTPAEACFDGAVRLAARVTSCPIALLGLVDESREWVKAAHGTRLAAVPREHAFCAETVLSGAPLVVPDLTRDTRFRANPFVTGKAALRAYAGIPVMADGHAVGAVCVLDTHPRDFEPEVVAALTDVAAMLSEMLASRLKEQRWRLQEERVHLASQAGVDWLWESDTEGRVSWVSHSMERHTGQRVEDEIGRPVSEFTRRRNDPDHARSHERYQRARARLEPFDGLIVDRPTPGGVLAVSISGAPMFDAEGRFTGYRGATRVVTEELRARREAAQAQALREEQLRESEARTAAVLQALPDQWFVLNARGGFIASGTGRSQRGFGPGDVAGLALDDVLPGHVAAMLLDALARAISTHSLQRVEYELIDAEGSRRHEARFMPMSATQVLMLVRDLTELRDMERDLLIMLRAIEAEAAMPLTVVDARAPDQPLVYVNPAFERMTGYRRDEVLGRNCRFLQGNDRQQPGLALLRQALAAGESCTVVLNNYRKDGSRFICELHLAPVHDAQGQVSHFIAMQTDITERSAAAERLRMSEALYRSVALSISDGLMVMTSGGYVIAANPAACRILDASMENLVRTPALDLLTEDLEAVPVLEHPAAVALRSGLAVAERVFGLRLGDGQLRWLGMSAQPLSMAADEPTVSAVVTFRDITRQREAEQALALSEERWKFALEGSGDGVWDWDVKRERVYYSRRWKEILGYGDHELSDSRHEWLTRLHPDDRAQALEKVQSHLRGDTPAYQCEHRMRHRLGHDVWALERGRVVRRNAQGQAERVVGTFSDITLLKDAEKALRDKQAAELASRAKSQFLSRMSHEMRTPLNALIGFSQLLKIGAGQAPAAQVRYYADHMLQAGQHLLALINDVLDLQRVEAGHLPLNIETVSLRRLVAQTVDLLAPTALSAAVHFDNGIDEDVLVMADSQRLRQVLMNVISNAIKYNRADGRVRLRLGDRLSDAIDILIEDTGEGLRPDQLARLFQPFERLGRETSPVSGSGLGLVIAKSAIEEMGGSIEVSSEPGTGTTVTLMLRLAQQAPASVASVESVAASSDAPASAWAARPRMLYVEDNPINALLFEEAMRLSGAVDLMIAEDGPQAFEIVRDWRPDVLVLDAHLPGMSGFDVLQRLRDEHGLHEVPAFMCSADAMPEDIARALSAGFVGYWTKPIEVHRVLSEIEQVAPRLHRQG